MLPNLLRLMRKYIVSVTQLMWNPHLGGQIRPATLSSYARFLWREITTCEYLKYSLIFQAYRRTRLSAGHLYSGAPPTQVDVDVEVAEANWYIYIFKLLYGTTFPLIQKSTVLAVISTSYCYLKCY